MDELDPELEGMSEEELVLQAGEVRGRGGWAMGYLAVGSTRFTAVFHVPC